MSTTTPRSRPKRKLVLPTEAEADDDPGGNRTDQQHVCRATGRQQGLVGKYDIWLSRQAFREIARDMGFRKYE